MILIDSTHYIDWLRNRTDFPRLLHPWIKRQEILTCGVIRVEVIRGVINPQQRKKVEEFFALLKEVPVDDSTWEAAADLAWSLDRKGVVLPLSDLIIAVCAKLNGAVLISSDQHFQSIPGLDVRAHLDSIL